MGKYFFLSILLCSQIFAAENFGGVDFHSTVTQEQKVLLKEDLQYLYQNPHVKTDVDFLKTVELKEGPGPSIHNWLINRVKVIVGQDYQLHSRNLIKGKRYKYPEVEALAQTQSSGKTATTVMFNLGSALYLTGKEMGILMSAQIDDMIIPATSPRVGILKVGEGLFLDRFLINPDPHSSANKIFRLSTLMHEARHSDGSGKNVTFLHATCPENHPYANVNACDQLTNGSYSVGALTQKQLLKNCSQCSVTDKTAIETKIADALNRVLKTSVGQKMTELQENIESYEKLITNYKSMLIVVANKDMESEVSKLENDVAQMKLKLADLEVKTPKAQVDASPEGEFKEIGLKESMRLMEKSLGQKR